MAFGGVLSPYVERPDTLTLLYLIVRRYVLHVHRRSLFFYFYLRPLLQLGDPNTPESLDSVAGGADRSMPADARGFEARGSR